MRGSKYIAKKAWETSIKQNKQNLIETDEILTAQISFSKNQLKQALYPEIIITEEIYKLRENLLKAIGYK